MKNCKNKQCTESNPQLLDKFNKDKSKADGLQRNCRTCTRLHTTTWMKENKDTVRLYKRSWDKVHKQEEMRLYRYNLSTEEYQKLFIEQEGCCYICHKHQSQLKTTLSVDHNHLTKLVRGLLCRKCNTAIGMLDDKIENLERAIEYLRRSYGKSTQKT
jgi:hypothetical protein